MNLKNSGNNRATNKRINLPTADYPPNNRRIIDAYLRAKVIHENKLAVGAECQESVTTVYKLMEELGTIQYNKQKDKYELYNC